MSLSLDSCVTFSGFDCVVPLSSEEGGCVESVDGRELCGGKLERYGAVYPFVPQFWHSEVLVLPGEPPVGASSTAGKCSLWGRRLRNAATCRPAWA